MNSPETLAEYITSRYSDKITLVRRNHKLTKNGHPDESEKNIIQVNGEALEGIWNPGNKSDVGLIAKLSPRIRGRNITIFILGGINHFGTERMGDYLSKNWQEMHKKAKSASFVALYDINDNEPIPIKEKAFHSATA